MSPLLVLVASAVVGFVATRTARRHSARYEERLLSPRLRARRRELASTPDASVEGDDYAAAALASLEDELRAVRGRATPSLYTPGEARRAKAAMAPMFGITMRVKP